MLDVSDIYTLDPSDTLQMEYFKRTFVVVISTTLPYNIRQNLMLDEEEASKLTVMKQ